MYENDMRENEAQMSGAQRAVFPGLIFGICLMFGMISLLTNGFTVHLGSQNRSATYPGCSISGSYPESIQQWCGQIERYASENSIDPNLISAVMLQESAGKANAYSKDGAVGLLQVMPRDGLASNFMCPGGPCFSDRPSTAQLFDPDFNISYGTQMLADLVAQYGDVREALKAYGPKDVGYYYADIVLGILASHR